MNVQVEVKGRGKVDFSLAPLGWVRDPRLEFCGVDDADKCFEPVTQFFKGLQPMPFENVNEEFVEAAEKDLQNALEIYLQEGLEVNYSNTIHISIRPVPKSSRDSTPEEVAAFVKRMSS